ncbi:MAG: ribonuclease HII [Alphaproteobacteria bacterium]|nr:ribonuclease HII [Alphaproteobacteria bacterium]
MGTLGSEIDDDSKSSNPSIAESSKSVLFKIHATSPRSNSMYNIVVGFIRPSIIRCCLKIDIINFHYTSIMKTTYSLGKAVEVGIDEAGRGCFWGPLYAGAVIWPPEEEWTDKHREVAPKINDSKKISEKKRDAIAKEIKEAATKWGVGCVTSSEIDEKGMSWANQEAFRRALRSCTSEANITPDLLLIDGILGLPKEDGLKFQCIPGGDGMYLPIAAASILAKVSRDN